VVRDPGVEPDAVGGRPAGRDRPPRKSASRVGDRLIERHLRGLNPALVALHA
jgi:hypothetical protein